MPTSDRWTSVVTGAGSGIGESAAILLSRHGSSVVLVGRTRARLEETRRQIESHAR